MIGETNQFTAAPRCGARTRAAGACKAPAMRNGRCHKHGGKVRLNLANGNAVTHGRRRRRVVEEKRLLREMVAHGRVVLRAVKRAHRAEMTKALAALRDERLNHQGSTGHQDSRARGDMTMAGDGRTHAL